MIDKKTIKRWKEEGETIITSQTFRKSVKFLPDGSLEYKGKTYIGHDWLLTYGHKKYQRLINGE